MDLRYLSRSQFARDQTHQAVTEVMSFLETIYTSVAENLPDVRDETYDGEPDHETSVDDPYSLHIGLYQQDSEKGCQREGFKGQETPPWCSSLPRADRCRGV